MCDIFHTFTFTQKNRLTENRRKANRQTHEHNRQIEVWTNGWTEKQTDKPTGGRTDKQVDGQETKS